MEHARMLYQVASIAYYIITRWLASSSFQNAPACGWLYLIPPSAHAGR